MLSPATMKIIKVTTRSSLEKELIRAIHDHSEIEFIDVEKKGLGSGSKALESDLEQEVLNLLGKISSMVDNLQIIPFQTDDRKNLEFNNLSKTLSECKAIYNKLQPEFSLINSKLYEANRELTELDTLLETIKILSPLNLEFRVLGKGKYFSVFTGSLGTEKIERLEWNLNELTNDSVIFSSSPISGEKGLSALVVGALHKYRDDIARILSSFGFVELNPPKGMSGKPDEVEESSLRRKAELENEIQNWESKKAEFVDKYKFDLLAIKEQLIIEKERIEAKKLMKQTDYVLQFWGYVAESEIKNAEALIKSIDPDSLFELEEKEFHDDEYPTKMENSKYIGKPYEELVQTFGTPEYGHDYDPSALFSITFPILFGIMFADIFHGFLLVLLAAWAMTWKPLAHKPEGMMEDAKNYLKNGSFILLMSGIASMIFGVLFWSFAGLHGEHAPSFMQEGGFLYFLHPLHLWSNNAIKVPMFANAPGSFLFLQLSLVIAIVHISLALFMLFINKIRHKHYKEAIFFPGMLLVAYLSAASLVFSYGLNVFSWFSLAPNELDIAVLTPIFGLFLQDGFHTGIMIPGFTVTIIMILAFATFFVFELIDRGPALGVSEGLDFIISLLGNSISYVRLFAINLVHSILALLIYSILNLPEKLPFDTVHEVHTDTTTELLILISFIIGTLIVMTFELMVTFLQAFRLHLVEFFSKLHYSGTGRMFMPFKSYRMYTHANELNEVQTN